MDKVLIIPDIHGLDFWKSVCKTWNDLIIFLGDYVDPYPPIAKEEAFENLEKLVDFYKNTNCTCKFLLGNHDWSYLSGVAPCRFDYKRKKEIKSLLKELDLSICTYIKSGKKTYLFSHAGITNGWLSDDDYMNKEFVVPNEFYSITSKLSQIPLSRGGYSKYGSCIWNDIDDFQNEKHTLNGEYQIFSHSWGGRTQPIIENDYAMLDCHKPFILDLKTDKIYET